MQLTPKSRRKLNESNSPANINGIYNSKCNHTTEEIRTKITVSSCAEKSTYYLTSSEWYKKIVF